VRIDLSIDGKTTMSSELLCQDARSWEDLGSFHTRLRLRFMIFIASFRNVLGYYLILYIRIIGRSNYKFNPDSSQLQSS
jgi:hypothetical protein